MPCGCAAGAWVGRGGMAARLMDWVLVGTGEYILLDADRALLNDSRRWLARLGGCVGPRSDVLSYGLQVGDLRVRPGARRAGRYLEAAHGAQGAQGAQGVPADGADCERRPGPGGRAGDSCPGSSRLLVPGGVDLVHHQLRRREHPRDGDPPATRVTQAYDRDMDERVPRRRVVGQPERPPLFDHLRAAGSLLGAGGGVVRLGGSAGGRERPGRWCPLLRSILNIIEDALRESPGSGRTGGPGRLGWLCAVGAGSGQPYDRRRALFRGPLVRPAPERAGAAWRRVERSGGADHALALGLGGQVGGVGLGKVQAADLRRAIVMPRRAN